MTKNHCWIEIEFTDEQQLLDRKLNVEQWHTCYQIMIISFVRWISSNYQEFFLFVRDKSHKLADCLKLHLLIKFTPRKIRHDTTVYSLKFTHNIYYSASS